MRRLNDGDSSGNAGISRRKLMQASALALGVGTVGLPMGCSNSGRSKSSGLQSLAKSLTGELLLPAAPGFHDENLPANDIYENVVPVGIAMCATPDDVQKCVRWCREEGIQPVIRGGGHNYIGASTTTGLLIKTTRMNRSRSIPQRE
jgi:hypothetical protein